MQVMLTEYLNIFLSHLNVVARKVAAQNKLSLSQYYTLTNISSTGITMSELSLLVGVDNSTLTRNINVLIKRSLVKKHKSLSDKREYLIVLSSKGLDLTETLVRDMDKFMNKFIDGIDETQRQYFIDIIEQINWKMSCFINEL